MKMLGFAINGITYRTWNNTYYSQSALNHPTPAAPSFAACTFGQITANAAKTGERSLQGQVRLNF